MTTQNWVNISSGMACCLTAPSHYPNQCWLAIGEVLWQREIPQRVPKLLFSIMSLKIIFLKLLLTIGQWVNKPVFFFFSYIAESTTICKFLGLFALWLYKNYSVVRSCLYLCGLVHTFIILQWNTVSYGAAYHFMYYKTEFSPNLISSGSIVESIFNYCAIQFINHYPSEKKSMKTGHDNFFYFQKIKTNTEVVLTPHKDTLNTPTRSPCCDELPQGSLNSLGQMYRSQTIKYVTIIWLPEGLGRILLWTVAQRCVLYIYIYMIETM